MFIFLSAHYSIRKSVLRLKTFFQMDFFFFLSAYILSNKCFCLYVCELIQAFRQRAEWRDLECLYPVYFSLLCSLRADRLSRSGLIDELY